jgi:hypothetical protein
MGLPQCCVYCQPCQWQQHPVRAYISFLSSAVFGAMDMLVSTLPVTRSGQPIVYVPTTTTSNVHTFALRMLGCLLVKHTAPCQQSRQSQSTRGSTATRLSSCGWCASPSTKRWTTRREVRRKLAE